MADQRTVTLVTDENAAVIRAVGKWADFMTTMWESSKVQTERVIRLNHLFGWTIRVVIICLAAAVTSMSGLEVTTGILTAVSGTLTALTGIEAYFRFTERSSMATEQQREIRALRDELRYKFHVQVELETDIHKKLENAKELLKDGPAAYNAVLKKYAFKSDEQREAPATN